MSPSSRAPSNSKVRDWTSTSSAAPASSFIRPNSTPVSPTSTLASAIDSQVKAIVPTLTFAIDISFPIIGKDPERSIEAPVSIPTRVMSSAELIVTEWTALQQLQLFL